MKKRIAILWTFLSCLGLSASAAVRTVSMLPGEDWRGAATHFGTEMPFDRGTKLEIDLRKDNYYNQKIIRDFVRMRQAKFAAKFVELAKECGRTGEPMIRHLDYMFPGNGYGKVRDQFVMGDFLMVAPVVEKGARSRTVLIPPGKWTADDGSVYEGPCQTTVEAPLSRLPYFVRND